IYQASYSLEAGKVGGVSDPEYLSKVANFVSWLRTRPEVAHVNSFSDTMKRLNMNMHADNPQYHRLPENRELGAQYLLLYEMSLPYGLDVNDQINIDKSALRVDVTYGDVDLSVIEKSVADSQRWLDANGIESMKSARGSGPALMFASITRRNIDSNLIGTTIGFAIIAAVLAFALRSFKMGAISLIPNILPAAIAFGVWALVVGEVGFAISVVAGLSIGIIVDDTVHFLSKYQRAQRELGLANQEAIRYAFKTVGSAIVGTSIIVTAGFAMLGLSTFRVTAYMGYLTSIAILAALVTDLLLL
ncbi:MAG: MMPL family transporter, partial [Deltaproteobacteria bacterium]|nr:MMPL family transporter [Deltaproteobacteria bacterium]